ncbi:MAG: hypothetical protein PHO46_10300 [Thermoguttaceae bacterium]|nr:hypothetical protein [Thermoguttaceae bacterium]
MTDFHNVITSLTLSGQRTALAYLQGLSDGRNPANFVATPPTPTPQPAVVVIHSTPAPTSVKS